MSKSKYVIKLYCSQPMIVVIKANRFYIVVGPKKIDSARKRFALTVCT